MELNVAAMVLASAALHPVWNALIKRDARPEIAFLRLLLLIVCIAGVQAALMGANLLEVKRVLPEVAISWGGQVLYATALVATLKRGDLSAYYPIVRSSPLFIVLVGVTAMGESYSWTMLLGIFAVLCGALLLQHRQGARRGRDWRTLAFSVLAMAGTGIYAMADARALRQVEPVVVLFWVHLVTAPAYALIIRKFGAARIQWRDLIPWSAQPCSRLAAALLCYGSYYLILIAFGMGGNVAAITAVRQASIPISVLIGGLILRESGMARRLAASLIMAAGIGVIVLAR